MSEHALISPSAAHRWLHCTPSIRLEQQFGDGSSEYAAEGSLAHAIAELQLKQYFKQISPIVATEGTQAFPGLITLRQDKYYTPELQKRVDEYVSFVIETFNSYLVNDPNTLIFIEQRFDLGSVIPGSFGTGDACILSGSTLHMVDLKMGKGVPVDAIDNPQQKLYAKGAIDQFSKDHFIDVVVITIFQPRIDNTNTWETSVDEIEEWIITDASPAAKAANEGVGEYVPGDHCRFCKAKAVCRANANYNLEHVKETFLNIDVLNPEEISAIILRLSNIQSWLRALKAYAISEALKGKKWPGLKLVEGTSKRRYSDEKAIASVLIEKGFSEKEFYSSKLIPIKDMEELLGKKTFKEMLSQYVVKPYGAPTLTDALSKKAEYNSVQHVAEIFSNFEEEGDDF